MRQRHKRISILLLLAMVIQIFTPFMNNIGYAEGKEVLSGDFIEEAIENVNEDNLDYLEKVRQKDVAQGSDLTNKISLSNVELSSDGESVSFSANWEITPKETKVNTGDYFYITIEGELIDYPDQLGRDGVIGRHEGGGKYKFTIPQEFDKYEEVNGKFSAEGRIKNNGTISLGDKSIEVEKKPEGENGSNNISDGRNDLDKTGAIIKEDGKYYVQWYVFIGDYNKPVLNASFTDIIGEGLKLDKNSLTVRYIDKTVDYSSQSEKLDSESKSALDGNIEDISLDDKKISFTVSDSRIDGYNGTIEVGYKTEILDITKDYYTNKAELTGGWNDSSTDISIEWSSDGSSSGVMKPNLDNENISIDVKKGWKGIESLPREEIKIILLANDEPAKNSEDENLKLILSNENDWTGKFENLPKYDDEGNEINYKVRECGEENGSITISNIKFSVEYTGDKENGFMITNKKEETTENDKTKAKGKFTLKKVDSKDESNALKGAKFTLIKDDNILEKIIRTLTKEDDAVSKTTDKDGKITFEDLKPGKYILKETKAPEGYKLLGEEITIEVTENGEVKLGKENNEKYTFENNVLIVKNEKETVNIEVNKEWKDSEGNELTETPKEIKVKLYNGDEPVKDSEDKELELTLSDDNNWTGNFENLPKYDDEGNEIKYTVKEYIEKEKEAVQVTERDENKTGYTLKVTGNIEEGFTITNTKVKPEEPTEPGEEDPEDNDEEDPEDNDEEEPEDNDEEEPEDNDEEEPEPEKPTKPIIPEPEPVDPVEPDTPEPEEPEEPEIPEVPEEEEEPEEPEEDVGGVIVEPEEPEEPEIPEIPEEEEPEVPEEDVGGVIVEPEEEEEEPVKPEEDVAGVVVDEEEDKVEDEAAALPKTGENSTIFLILGLVFIMTGIILKRKIFA